MNTTPNFEAAKELLQLLEPSPDALFCFMAIGPDGAKPSPIIRTWHGTLAKGWQTLQRFNTERSCGTYVAVQQMNGEGRSEADVVRIRAAYAELDDGLPDQPWPLEPSMIVESSPGRFHCWWIVEGEGLTYEEFRGIERRMVADWKSDKGVIDAARVLRLPGFLHQKNPDQPHLIRTVGGTRARYTSEQILAAFPPIPEPASKPRKASTAKESEDTAAWMGGSCGDWRTKISTELWADICREGPEGKRSSHSYSVMLRLLALKLTDDDLLACATTAPACFARKFIQRGDIKKEVARCRRRWETKSYPFDSIETPEAMGSETLEKPAISNARAAAEFANEYSGRHKFNHTTKTWMTFNGVVWVQDQKGETLDQFAKFCYGRGKGDNRFSKDTEQLARNLPEFAVTTDMFDRDDWLLATPAGYVDLKTGEMTPPEPQKLVSKCTAVAPNKEPAPRFRQFLNEITGAERPAQWTDATWDAWHEALDLISFLQRFFGYCLCGDTREQMFAFFLGDPGSGKTTLVQAVAKAMGSYHKTSSPAALLASRNTDANAPQPFLAAITGIRLATMAETKTSMVFDGPIISRLTGGEPVQLRDLHQKPFEFIPKLKALIYGNDPPAISGSAAAIARRAYIVPFNRVFKAAVGADAGTADKELSAKLDKEQGAILQWMIDGCLLWQKHGLNPPAIVIKASQKFMRDADAVAQWVEERLVKDPSGRLWNTAAYADWKDFARQRGREPGSNESFGHKLKDHLGGETTPGKDELRKSSRYRTGWRLATAADRAVEEFTEVAPLPTGGEAKPAGTALH